MSRVVVDPRRFRTVFEAREKARAERVAEAVHEAAMLGAELVARAAPIDVGTLKSSIHAARTSATASEVVADAPHAGILEVGSRPHMPPLQPLIDWVRRHKMYFTGATKKPAAPARTAPRRRARLATQVKRAVRKGVRRLGRAVMRLLTGGARRGRGGKPGGIGRAPPRELSEADIEAIARAIQHKIAQRGTAPRWFMRSQLPRMRKVLGIVIRRRIKDAP